MTIRHPFADPPPENRQVVSTAFTLRRLTRTIAAAAVRETGNAAASTTIGGVFAWWFSHR